MRTDSTRLLAYVDGLLSPEDCADIETQIAKSPALAREVELLRASQLPYAAAFRAQVLPPMPESLREYAAAAIAMPRASRPEVPHPSRSGDEPLRTTKTPRITPARRFAPQWLAVAFVTGVFISGAVLHFVPGFGGGRADERPSWVAAAAGYQALYTRDTVAQVPVDDKLTSVTVDDINHKDGLDVAIPDLRQAGLSFKRVQRLQFRDRPLVQIVYLPAKGSPVALCVMKEPKADAAPREQRVATMAVVTWRRNQLSYALIGDSTNHDLPAIAQQLADNNVESLFKPTTPPHAG